MNDNDQLNDNDQFEVDDQLDNNDELINLCKKQMVFFNEFNYTYMDEINTLIDLGADLNYANYDITPFMHLCLNPHITKDLINYFITRGANINHIYKNETLLHIMCKNGRLISNGIFSHILSLIDKNYINFQNDVKRSALSYLIFKHANTITTELIDMFILYGADLTLNGEDNSTMLNLCLTHVDISDEIVLYFIKLGIDINAKNQHNSTVLHLLCHNNRPTTLIKKYIKYGGDVTLLACNNQNILGLICNTEINININNVTFENAFNTIKLLIQSGLNINDKNIEEYNNSPLYYLCSNDEYMAYDCSMTSINVITILQYMYDNNADFNIINENGNTILHRICMNKNIPCGKIIQFIINHITIPNILYLKNNESKTPIQILCEHEHCMLTNVASIINGNTKYNYKLLRKYLFYSDYYTNKQNKMNWGFNTLSHHYFTDSMRKYIYIHNFGSEHITQYMKVYKLTQIFNFTGCGSLLILNIMEEYYPKNKVANLIRIIYDLYGSTNTNYKKPGTFNLEKLNILNDEFYIQ